MNRILMYLAMSLVAIGNNLRADDNVETLRPVTAAYTVELGSSHLTDTYLSPIKYDGWHAAFNYERRQAMRFDPEHWTMRLEARVGVDCGDNIARNATMWNLDVSFRWGMMRRWKVADGLTLAAGGSTGINGGCLYNARNGNNPVSAKAAWTVNLTGYAAYNMRLWRLPVTLCYQPTLPVTGAFFSPDYGELYYEIYLGNHSGLAHCAWWGNYFRLDNQLTADIHFGATSLRVGYRCDILSTKANEITTNVITHSAVIGVSGEWMSYNPSKGLSDKARIISALF